MTLTKHLIDAKYRQGNAVGEFLADIELLDPTEQEIVRFGGKITDRAIAPMPTQDLYGMLIPHAKLCLFLKLPGDRSPIHSIIYETMHRGDDPLNTYYEGNWYSIPPLGKSLLEKNPSPDLYWILKTTTEIFSEGTVNFTISRK
ncbi:MAG TPA: hypothetical protein VK158_01680 [Acidobacteriota bacterium]|nr:hypothetical protein [Acidobacteriota bacterium]